ncbi:uncharacterized protein LOC144419964 [Styela clava]
MERLKLLFLCIGFSTAVDISVKVQFRGRVVVTSYRQEETITAKNEQELRNKLTQNLEEALLDKQIDEVTITTEIYHGNNVHSTEVTKFDLTTPNQMDGTTFVTEGNDITKDVTSSATRNISSTDKINDVTTTNAFGNEHKTQSITSITSTRFFQESTSTLVTENCGLIYNSKCFRAIVYDRYKVTLSDAESLCESKLANIYDVTH